MKSMTVTIELFADKKRKNFAIGIEDEDGYYATKNIKADERDSESDDANFIEKPIFSKRVTIEVDDNFEDIEWQDELDDLITSFEVRKKKE